MVIVQTARHSIKLVDFLPQSGLFHTGSVETRGSLYGAEISRPREKRLIAPSEGWHSVKFGKLAFNFEDTQYTQTCSPVPKADMILIRCRLPTNQGRKGGERRIEWHRYRRRASRAAVLVSP